MARSRLERGPFGKSGEQIAASHLIAEGYEILAKNYRFRRYEIDIVARKEDTLVFVEVKTRSSQSFGHPVLSVTIRKTRRILEAASAYLEREKLSHLQARFDIITLLFVKNAPPRVEHIENAFQVGR